MRREYCDRCGVEGMDRRERKAAQYGHQQAGVKVVRVTFVPLARVLDLCGQCRRDLDGLLDEFAQGSLLTTATVGMAPAGPGEDE